MSEVRLSIKVTLARSLVACLAMFVAFAAQASESPADQETERAAAESAAPGQTDEDESELADAFGVDEDDPPAEGGAAGSNPLASVTQLDLSWTYLYLGGGRDVQDFQLFGSVMLHPRLKLVSELHYWRTDVTGSREYDWESFHLKPIFFPYDTVLNESWKMRVAVGAEWILDFDNQDKGIGSGSDQIAPLMGLAFNHSGWGITLVPLVQHFMDYNGVRDINTTAFRLIGIQKLPAGQWLKLDARAPRDWENHETPVSVELEYGKMFNRRFGAFMAGTAGVGGDRPFDMGVKIALRTVF